MLVLQIRIVSASWQKAIPWCLRESNRAICASSIRQSPSNAENPSWCAPIGFTKAKTRPWQPSKFWKPKANRLISSKAGFRRRTDCPRLHFIDERPKSAITFIAPVIRVVKVRSEQSRQIDSESILYDKEVLALCFEALKPVFTDLESEKFTSILDCLYRKVLKSGEKDLSVVAEIVKLLIKK